MTLTKGDAHPQKEILLFGSCEYELIGFENILSRCNHNALRIHNIEDVFSHPSSLIVVALSSEPLLQWARFITTIKILAKRPNKRVIIFTPRKLMKLAYLKTIGLVFNGKQSVQELQDLIKSLIQSNLMVHYKRARLSIKQQKELIRLRLMLKQNFKNRSIETKNIYYHRSRMLKIIGVDNLHVAIVSGLLLNDHCI
ncbi:hypothetical protein SNN69_004343 [Cronobacter sakazakii]|nr:hypothetical protein [Cronobacter sakazakii]ELY5804900.1 hypothetical protein [Cronobacter sakazakii]ELY5855549.1 hypothetical protein [Cronobacter malonaticus]HAY0261304.1 hypothetical protein [Escherichia coli]